MFNKWKSSLLIGLMMAVALAQTTADIESPAVNRIAKHLKCNCGCNQDMACVMPPGCPVCKMNKSKIFKMQQSGMSDQQILDQYVAENSRDILVIPPGVAGVAGPYIALGLGLIVVLWTIRRYVRPGVKVATAGGPDVDPALLAKIEKDTADLD
jgi:cytochrome c-type biogenesis protein CcmH/NrfF